MIDDKLGKRYKWAHCPHCGQNDWWLTDPLQAVGSHQTAMRCGYCEKMAAPFPRDHTPVDELQRVTRLERIVIACIRARLTLAGQKELMEFYNDGDAGRVRLARMVVHFSASLCEEMEKYT